jgi:hypothetical protein
MKLLKPRASPSSQDAKRPVCPTLKWQSRYSLARDDADFEREGYLIREIWNRRRMVPPPGPR